MDSPGTELALLNRSIDFDPSNDSNGNLSDDSNPEMEHCDGYGEREFLQRSIWIYGGYPILALGTVGHLLSVLVLLIDRSMRKVPLSTYLVAMSLAGLIALYAGLLPTVVKYHSCHHFVLQDQTTETGCRLQMAVMYFSLQLYSWMEACVSMERLFAVTRPHDYKVRFTQLGNMLATAIIALILIGLNVIPYTAYGYNKGVCAAVDNDLFRKWRHIHTAIYAAIPVAVMVPSNGFTLRIIYRSPLKNNANIRKAKSVTATMLILNGVFVVTAIPIMVGDWDNLDDSSQDAVVIAWAFCRLAMYLGSSLTFAVYLAVSTKYRKALGELFNSGAARLYAAASVLSGGACGKKGSASASQHKRRETSSTTATSDGKVEGQTPDGTLAESAA